MSEEITKEDKKKKKNKVKKIIDWVVTGVFGSLIVLVGGLKIYQAISKDPYTFGYQFPVVLTDSMEDTYMVGDMLVIKKVDPSVIKEGDDISFYWDINGTEMSMTHRVQSVTYYEDVSLNDGYNYTFVTHGINKASSQCPGPGGEPGDCTYQTQTFHENKLIGKVVSNSKVLTAAYKAFKSPWSLLVIILIPSMYLIVTSVIDICKALDNKEEVPAEGAETNGDNKDVNNSALSGLSQKDIERLKKELLDEMIEAKKKQLSEKPKDEVKETNEEKGE